MSASVEQRSARLRRGAVRASGLLLTAILALLCFAVGAGLVSGQTGVFGDGGIVSGVLALGAGAVLLALLALLALIGTRLVGLTSLREWGPVMGRAERWLWPAAVLVIALAFIWGWLDDHSSLPRRY